MESPFKYKCYENGYTELSEKFTVFKKYLLLKKIFFWKSSCLEEVTALKNDMFWVTTYSGEKAPLKQYLCHESIYLQEVAIQKSVCYQKVVTRDN